MLATERAKARFLATIQRTVDGHWLWQGVPTAEGYGRFRDRQWLGYAHAWAWAHWKGPKPPITRFRNVCGKNQAPEYCVNPDHWSVDPIKHPKG